MRALLSVYDKTGIAELGRDLVELGWELVASGKTESELRAAGLPVLAVADVTGSPEMLGGRVKTLHPAIHGGILADRSVASHMDDLAAQGIVPIDLVVVNLYPFSSDPSVELIDVGGPTMVRAAAKNFAHVGVVVSPGEYAGVLHELRTSGALSAATRRRLARAAFAHCVAYDAAIVEWLDGGAAAEPARDGEAATAPAGGLDDVLPTAVHLELERVDVLRYGENPHQVGARYRVAGGSSWWDQVTQHAGSALSYLNLFDTDAAWRVVHEMIQLDQGAAVAIVKHANACGAALADTLVVAYERALECDPTSAFGGILAIGGPATKGLADAIAQGPQADVIIASTFEPEAVEVLSARRKATRLLSAPPPEPTCLHLRTLSSNILVQEPDVVDLDPEGWEVVTKQVPTDAQWRDLRLAWLLCARTTSNAITVVRDAQGVGVGAGQQSRVVAAEIAVSKAGDRSRGASAASDAFFPFPDGLQVLARTGVSAVVQPGGSVRDGDVIAEADAAGMAMVLTGTRHFRH